MPVNTHTQKNTPGSIPTTVTIRIYSQWWRSRGVFLLPLRRFQYEIVRSLGSWDLAIGYYGHHVRSSANKC